MQRLGFKGVTFALKWFQNSSVVSFPKTSQTFGAYRPNKVVNLKFWKIFISHNAINFWFVVIF